MVGSRRSIALGSFLHSHELAAPIALESAGPFVERSDLRCVGAIENLAAVAPYLYQSDISKHAEMLGDGRLRKRERQHDVANGTLAGREVFQDVSSAWLSNGVEGVGGRRRTRHDVIIFPYWNMSSHENMAVMTLTQMFLEQLDNEVRRTRNAIERVPRGKDDWAPHPKSMPLMQLAGMVASMPSWIALIINTDELDLNPPGGKGQYQQPTAEGLIPALDKAAADGRAALSAKSDDFLVTTNWKLLVSGKTVVDAARYVFLADTFTHLAHHRGQLTVYLRLLDQQVPALYGPSADDPSFG